MVILRAINKQWCGKDELEYRKLFKQREKEKNRQSAGDI